MNEVPARVPKAATGRTRLVKPKNSEPENVVQRLRKYSDEDLVRRWHDMLGIIRGELQGLDRQRQTMDAVTYGVFNENKRLLVHPGRRFFSYVLDWYAGAMAIAYRRQADANPDSASLRVLLDEMRARPAAYRLELIRPYVGPVAEDDVIRAQIMAPVLGANGALALSIIDADIAALTAAGRKVRKFVNKSFAHTDRKTRREGGVEVTFGEIKEANEACEGIAERWLKALGGYHYPIRHEETFEWLDIFDFPWRLKRPRDDCRSRRYVVSVDVLLDDADLGEMFESQETYVEYWRARVAEIADLARGLQPNGVLNSETCLPVITTVERLL